MTENTPENLNGPSNEQSIDQKNANQTEGGTRIFFELVKVVFWALIIIIPIRTFLFQPFFVQGASMEPNFYDGEYLIVNELGYKETALGIGGANFFTVKPFRELARDDVVVFRYPKNPKQFFIKRVIGLPGEKVEIGNGTIKIFNQSNPSGFFLDEGQYLAPSVETAGTDTFELTPDQYLVLGDNRTHSSDSRAWGPVPGENIIGKVLLRAWPPDRLKVF